MHVSDLLVKAECETTCIVTRIICFLLFPRFYSRL